MQGARRRPRPEPTHPDSHRFETTLSSDLERVAKQLVGSDAYDTSKRVGKLKATKLANTATSISFGNEVINYESDMASCMRKGGTVAPSVEREKQRKMLKDMKMGLSRTNFTLGDDNNQYTSANRDAMAKSTEYTYKSVSVPQDVKNAIKKSSIHFGNEKSAYKTCSAEGYDKDESTFAQAGADYATKRAEIAKQTATLRKHNFSFGEEVIEYVSDQTRGYGSVPVEAYGQRAAALPKIRETIQDSRSCHFNLGNDIIKYQSNTHSGFTGGGGISTSDRNAASQRVKDMKKRLQTTAIVIGDDASYM